MRDYEAIKEALTFYAATAETTRKTKTLLDAADAIEELLEEKAKLENSGKLLVAAFARLKEKVPKWISVEERLPEQGERVLVSNGGFICESYLSQSGKWQRGGVDMFFMTPTHWMPLLKPPKEVQDG